MDKKCRHQRDNCIHKLYENAMNPQSTCLPISLDKMSSNEFEVLRKTLLEHTPLKRGCLKIIVDECPDDYYVGGIIECIRPSSAVFYIKTKIAWLNSSRTLQAMNNLLKHYGRRIEVDMSESVIYSKNVAEFLELLKHKTKLGWLHLPTVKGSYQLFNETIRSLLTDNNVLQYLSLKRSKHFTDVSFCSALATNHRLRGLCFNYTKIFEKGAKHIASGLAHNSGLTTLDLDDCEIRDGANDIFESLTHNQTLQSLNLNCNQITENGYASFGGMLKHNTTLSYLQLSFNYVNERSAKLIAEPISLNYGNITTLNLTCCHLGNNSTFIILALSSNATITTLDLRCNEIDYRGALAVSQMLKSNTTLSNLDIMTNPLTEKGILAIAEGVAQNNTLDTLNLSYTFRSTNDTICEAFKLLLNPITPIQSLSIDQNLLQHKDYESLCELFKVNNSITDFWFEQPPEISNMTDFIKSCVGRNKHNNEKKDQTLFGIMLKYSIQSLNCEKKIN